MKKLKIIVLAMLLFLPITFIGCNKNKGILSYWDKSWCVSFKRNCLRPFPLNYFQVPTEPVDAKILVFHGRPNPEQAYEGFMGKGGLRYVKPTKWLDKYWEHK